MVIRKSCEEQDQCLTPSIETESIYVTIRPTCNITNYLHLHCSFFFKLLSEIFITVIYGFRKNYAPIFKHCACSVNMLVVYVHQWTPVYANASLSLTLF